MERVTDKLLNWASDIEQDTILQAAKTSRLPIVHGHVALMPDAHVGMGSTVGSVIPTKGAIIPAAVGVDIGCGMVATETTLTASDLPDNMDEALGIIGSCVPAGVGQGHSIVSKAAKDWLAKAKPSTVLDSKQNSTAEAQFGTLGSGNHFVEICLDERDVVWIVLHSGSRGIGNQLAQKHIKVARQLAKEHELKLEDPDLAYLTEGTSEFQAYIADMLWAQDYAMQNRNEMNARLIPLFLKWIGQGSVVRTINCHHNFTTQESFPSLVAAPGGVETRDLQSLWITRKGAIKADVGDLGVIPGSMGTRSYIVAGLGNHLSWNSCSHGAGRRMSRSAAKRNFTVDDLAREMEGKTWLSGNAQALLDEIPSSYKSIDAVMEDQKDLVRIQHTLHQVVNFKGV